MPHRSASLLSTALLALFASLMSACAGTPASGRHELGKLQLHTTLNIEPEAATVRLQYGRSVARNAVQEHDPFCILEIETVRPHAQTVQPGQFHIVAVSRSVETIASLPVSRTSWQIRRVSFNDKAGPTNIYYKTIFRLQNAEQPVRALTCMSDQNAPGNANFMRHLTLQEIREALGERFTLNLDR